MNILWVENHASFARLAVRQFLAAHTVTVVASLSAARAALANEAFETVIVDFDLDDGKGTEIVTALKQAARRPLIVAASSHAEGNRALVAAGADVICAKMEFSRIAEVIQSSFSGQSPIAGNE